MIMFVDNMYDYDRREEESVKNRLNLIMDEVDCIISPGCIGLMRI